MDWIHGAVAMLTINSAEDYVYFRMTCGCWTGWMDVESAKVLDKFDGISDGDITPILISESCGKISARSLANDKVLLTNDFLLCHEQCKFILSSIIQLAYLHPTDLSTNIPSHISDCGIF